MAALIGPVTMEESPGEEDQPSDDWDQIVDELLDIEVTPGEGNHNNQRKASAVSITLEAAGPEEEPTEHPSNYDNHRKASSVSINLEAAGAEGDPEEHNEEPSISQQKLLDIDPSLLAVEHVFIFEDPDSEILIPESECGEDSTDAAEVASEPAEEVLEVCETQQPTEFKEEIQTMCELVGQGDLFGIQSFIEEHQDDIGAICLVSDDTGRTPITAAAVGGYVDVLRTLSDAGVWLHCYDEAGYMAIHRAVDAGHQEVVEWLCGQGQWTGFTKSGLSALHIAAQNGHFAITNLLVDFVPNIDEETTTTIGQTALHLAVQNNHMDVTELLIGRGAKCNHANGDGKNALHLAAESGNADIVDKILLYSTESIDDKISGSLKSALHVAVENSHSQVVCKLLDYGANVEQPDGQGDTVLHKLCSSGLPSDCVDYMCRHSQDIDRRSRKGRSALFLAVENYDTDLVCALLEHGADPNKKTTGGCAALYAAAHHGHLDITEKLLAAGAAIDHQTDSGSTALYRAARCGHHDIVALLICSGARLDLMRKTGWTALHVAVHHRFDTVVEQLLSAGANPNAFDNRGQTALAIAAYNKSKSIVKILGKACQDPVSIFNVARLGNSEILKFMMYCRLDLEVANPLCGWRAIHHAAIEGNSNTILALNRAGLDINSQDNDGNTALHLAILHKHPGTVEALLREFCYTSVLNKRGETSLSLAVQRGYRSIVEKLLRHGVVFDEPDASGKRPLIHAIERGHKDVARILIAHGAIIKVYGNNTSKPSPVRLVCRQGNADLLKLMAHRGASIEQRDADGNTLLHTAAQHGNTDIVLELITMRGSLVNVENAYHKTPLHLAASEGHAFIVEALLSAGAKVSLMDQDERVNYDMAKHQAVWDILKQWAELNPSMLEPARNRSAFV